MTCPSCGAEWFYPEILELSEVEFRCAHSGARFVVQSSRRSPLHKFTVYGIKGAPPRPSATVRGSAPPAQRGRLEASNASPPPLPKSKSTGWLAQLFGKVVEAGPISSSLVTMSAAETTEPTPAPVRHDANEYNWASFFCPYCNASGFVECAGGHFACDGTVEIRSGRRFHRCYCGNACFIEGKIKTIAANQSTMKLEPVHPNPPPPQPSGPTEKQPSDPTEKLTAKALSSPVQASKKQIVP